MAIPPSAKPPQIGPHNALGASGDGINWLDLISKTNDLATYAGWLFGDSTQPPQTLPYPNIKINATPLSRDLHILPGQVDHDILSAGAAADTIRLLMVRLLPALTKIDADQKFVDSHLAALRNLYRELDNFRNQYLPSAIGFADHYLTDYEKDRAPDKAKKALNSMDYVAQQTVTHIKFMHEGILNKTAREIINRVDKMGLPRLINQHQRQTA